MPGEARPEASSQTLALKQIADVAKFAVQSQKERMAEMMRLMREAAKNARAKESDATIAIAEQPTPRAAQAQSVPIELERRAPEPVPSMPGKKIEERIADWCIAVGTALRGPWPDAVWDFYERMTDVATWWRFIKLVLKFLARLFPGGEPRPSRVSKAIREGFRFLHEPAPPWPPQWQPKKPPEDPPKAP